MTITEGSQRSQVWYLKKNAQGELCDQQMFASLEPIAKPIAAPSRPLTSGEEKDVDECSRTQNWDAGAIGQSANLEALIVEKRKPRPGYVAAGRRAVEA